MLDPVYTGPVKYLGGQIFERKDSRPNICTLSGSVYTGSLSPSFHVFESHNWKIFNKSPQNRAFPQNILTSKSSQSF